MARGTHWWNEPPLWAWIAMVVSAVTVAVLLPVALSRGAPAAEQVATSGPTTAAPSDDAAGSAEPEASAEPSEPAEPADGPARVVVIGDGDSAGEGAWPELVDEQLEEAEVEVAAEVGGGYTVQGVDGRTLPDLVEDVDLADADAVVVFGSRNDPAGVADDVSTAATGLFGRIRDAAPDAQLLVIGPQWLSADIPAGVRGNRDVVRDAAEAAEATFVDPLRERWFADRSDLVTGTGNPNADGQVYLAGLIEPLVRDLLPG